jgi:hypothetical protein
VYINDLPSHISQPLQEQPLGVAIDVHTPHAQLQHYLTIQLFADDLTLLDPSQDRLQTLLVPYGEERHASQCFQDCSDGVNPPCIQTNLHPSSYNGSPLPFVREFKFLGVWVDDSLSV